MTHPPEMQLITDRRIEYIRQNQGKTIRQLMADLRLSYETVYALVRKSKLIEFVKE